jgi:excisionase family DNA binding protein
MHRRLQFGMRENPASDRRHGSCQVTRNLLDRNCIEEKNEIPPPGKQSQSHQSVSAGSMLNAASRRAAMGDESACATTRSAIGVPSRLHVRKPRDFEPLIDSYEAARLLGSIHVKTLQRYARSGNVPGYQIGGHWYFRASELDSWLRSRLNSSCHPCRLQEKSDGT